MASLPWRKFQDFYLRLGFLKTLAAALDPQRRSALNEALVRRLEKPLFQDAPTYPALWERVKDSMTWYPRRTSRGETVRYPEVAEALLVLGDHESFLYGVTHDTAYKVLDWGRDVDFVGRGNQITERALILRHLMDEAATSAFLVGDVLAWNPFQLSLREKLFFLFHLNEIDEVSVRIVQMLGSETEGRVLESSDAARLTCRALIEVLKSAEPTVSPRDIPSYRVARELAATIAKELQLEQLLDESWATRPRAPRAIKPKARRHVPGTSRREARERHTTKNADHQTVPRFEQLVDLGLVAKPEEVKEGPSRSGDVRRRWRYVATDACRRWAIARADIGVRSAPFGWDGFAATAVSAFHGTQIRDLRRPNLPIIARHLWRAYDAVKRPIGHTPFDSVALYAMLDAAAEGFAVEMIDFHALMLRVKREDLAPGLALFASGNDLDKMFIQLKPGFVECVNAIGEAGDTERQH